MSCSITPKAAAEDPIWANENKGYDANELSQLISLIDQTQQWFIDKGIDGDTSNAIGIRVGVPYLGKDDSVDADTIYTGTVSPDRLIRTMSVDAIKISTLAKPWGIVDNTTGAQGYLNKPATFNETYTYKSKYIHRIFGQYFVNGIDNRSGIAALDTNDMVLDTIAPLYLTAMNDGSMKMNPTVALPKYISDCMQMIVQNIGLFKGFTSTGSTKGGDLIYFNTSDFYGKLTTIRANAVTRSHRLATPADEKVHDVLVTTGLDASFKQASRENQWYLEGLLTWKKQTQAEIDAKVPPVKERMRDVFKEVWVAKRDKDVDQDSRVKHLKDPYSSDMGVDNDYPVNPPAWKLDEEYFDAKGVPMFGCKNPDYIINDSGGVTDSRLYRHFMVDDAWLKQQPVGVISTIFWLGLDLDMGINSNPCPADKIITIILIITLAFTGNYE